MAVLIPILVLLAGGGCMALARVLRSRERSDSMTQEWIRYLQEDLQITP